MEEKEKTPEAQEQKALDLEPVEHDEDKLEEEEIAEKPDYSKEILEIVRSNDSPKVLRDRLEDHHANDIADVLPDLTAVERRKVYRVLDDDVLSDILEYLDDEDAALYLSEMDPKRAASIVTEIEPDQAVEILRKIPREKRVLLLDLMDADARNDVRLIASFDDEEIGSRMTTNFIVIHENLTVKEAMTELIKQAAENDNISTIFVVDENDDFYGAIDLKELIIARQTDNLEDLIVTSFPYVYGHESIDDCIEKLKDYSEDSIPVLDNQNHLIGVITSSDVIKVVDEEMGEDYAKLAGLTAEEDLEEPLKESIKKRLPWLVLLLALGMVVSSVVSMFEGVVEKLTIIMAFQSMILDMSGNVGTQSLAVTIRVLTDRGINGHMKLQLVRKEMTTGLANGFLLGIIAVAGVGFYIMLSHHMTPVTSIAISTCIGLSLLLAMVISSFVGTIVPMFFDKIGVDPAVASGPLITTITDLVGVVTYYSLAWIMLVHFLGM